MLVNAVTQVASDRSHAGCSYGLELNGVARIVVVGGGIVGLGASVMLARDGHQVMVLERDPALPPDPEEAWEAWERRGVNQFRLLHFFQPCYRELMDANAPDVVAAMLDAGALVVNPLRDAPVEVTGGFREGDERHDAVTARRPVAEAAIAQVVASTDNLEVRRGVSVVGLLTGDTTAAGVPHVVGVRTDAGEDVWADLVVDAAGRRSVLPAWLTDIGAQPPVEERADCGFVYYGRHLRSIDGSVPMAFGPFLQEYGTVSVLTLPADNGTWGVGLIASANDRAMRHLKDLEVWTKVIKTMPLCAHWLDAEPIDDRIAVMARIEDRHRSFVLGGDPIATGVVALADSWACTNPSVGRGISIGTMHAVGLRDLLHDMPADPVALQQQWNDVTMATAEPWYRSTLAFDESRLAEVDALLEGRPFEPTPAAEIGKALGVAAGKDPEMLRALLDIANVLSLPDEVFGRPGVFERVVELGGGWRDERLPGPSRDELVEEAFYEG
jgi:2-polyprenyl-6-methoxyphenol hydroxylase-like FAD-dependent oxidoreductase